MIDKKLFDSLWNIHEACELAEELGYDTNYLDGAECSDRYEKEMRDKITSLVGENWPQEVIDAYNKGCIQGSYDT